MKAKDEKAIAVTAVVEDKVDGRKTRKWTAKQKKEIAKRLREGRLAKVEKIQADRAAKDAKNEARRNARKAAKELVAA